MGVCTPLYHEKREEKARKTGELAIVAAPFYPFGGVIDF
jgi:hypothetical protein